MKKRLLSAPDRRCDRIPTGFRVRDPETDTKDDTGIPRLCFAPRTIPRRPPLSEGSDRTFPGKKAAAVFRHSAHGQNRAARDMGRPRGFRRLTPYAVPRTDGESDFPTNATGLHLSSACDPRPGERSSYPPPHERKEPDSDQSRPGRKNVRTSRLCASIRRRKTQTVPRKKCFATDSRPKK